jgi:hypothetical protein
MKKSAVVSLTLFPALLLVISAIFISNAEIPAGYAGTPFPPGSAPRELMGKIYFNEFDCGAINVSFYADDAWDGAENRNKLGQTAGPAFYTTNTPWDRDSFYAEGLSYPNGVYYPNPNDTTIHDCYIGASHPSNWTKWTVHVSKAGKYYISSCWSAMDSRMIFTINFLNGTKTVSTPTMDLPGGNSYHAWRLFKDFASVTLDTGVQVMHFQNGSMHLNQDFLYFATDSNAFNFPVTSTIQHNMKPVKAESPAISISWNTVRFTLKDAGMTKVSVFDCLGREIVPVLEKSLFAGDHSVALNTAGLKQGVYFLQIMHNGEKSVIRFHTLAR